MTEDIRFEDDTITHLEWTSILDSRHRNLEELSYRDHGVTLFNFVLNYTVLFVKVKVPLSYVVRGSPRRHEHHDLVVPLLTLLVGTSPIHPLGVVGHNTLWEMCAMSVRVVSIGETRTVTWNGLLPPVRLVVSHGIGVAVVVPDTLLGTPPSVRKLTFGTTQW
jgi:hypothetical protein